MSDTIDALVEYAATIDSDDIPEEILQITRDLLLDTMACILAGSSAAGIQELRESVAFWGGNNQSTVFSFDDQTSAPFAAFLNSVMCHANDFDDTHDAAVNHGCVTLVPALLAISEALGAPGRVDVSFRPSGKPISGREFIAALAVGLDVSNRLGMAFIPYLHVGWLPTTLWGPFACAAACGRILELDSKKMHHAFGLAYSQIHANRQGLLDGVLSKRVQPGFSASAGLQAAFFAHSGITAARHIIDGEFGLRALYTNGRIDREHLTESLGQQFETANVSIKPYPCCRCTHPVIDAALLLKKTHDIQWQDIRDGSIKLPPQSMGQIGNPFAIRNNPTVDAQFSAQYTAALTFIEGWPKMEDFKKETVLNREQVRQLASQFSICEFEQDNPGLYPVEMEVTLSDGRVFETRMETLKGSPNNPLNRGELEFKFSDCLNHSIKSYSDDSRAKMLEGLDTILDSDDIRKLVKLF